MYKLAILEHQSHGQRSPPRSNSTVDTLNAVETLASQHARVPAETIAKQEKARSTDQPHTPAEESRAEGKHVETSSPKPESLRRRVQLFSLTFSLFNLTFSLTFSLFHLLFHFLTLLFHLFTYFFPFSLTFSLFNLTFSLFNLTYFFTYFFTFSLTFSLFHLLFHFFTFSLFHLLFHFFTFSLLASRFFHPCGRNLHLPDRNSNAATLAPFPSIFPPFLPFLPFVRSIILPFTGEAAVCLSACLSVCESSPPICYF